MEYDFRLLHSELIWGCNEPTMIKVLHLGFPCFSISLGMPVKFADSRPALHMWINAALEWNTPTTPVILPAHFFWDPPASCGCCSAGQCVVVVVVVCCRAQTSGESQPSRCEKGKTWRALSSKTFQDPIKARTRLGVWAGSFILRVE